MIDFKLQASGIPDSIEQYQLALDAAFNAGKAIAAAGAAPDPQNQHTNPVVSRNADVLIDKSAAGATPVPGNWKDAVALAYGHLWHVNNEPMAPIPLRSEGEASYAARKLLRDLLTSDERGRAINAVRELLAAAPKVAP